MRVETLISNGSAIEMRIIAENALDQAVLDKINTSPSKTLKANGSDSLTVLADLCANRTAQTKATASS